MNGECIGDNAIAIGFCGTLTGDRIVGYGGIESLSKECPRQLVFYDGVAVGGMRWGVDKEV